MTVIYAVIPIILNAAVGFIVMRKGIFEQTFYDSFARLTFRYLIPCMLFASMVRADLAGLASVRLFWMAYFLPAILIFLAVRSVASSTLSLAVTYSNSVLIGIPLVIRAFGDEALSPTFTIISVNGLTLFTMVALTGISGSQRGANIIKPVIGTLQNPIIIALLLGASVNFLAIPIFAPLTEAIALAGQAALPSALFILGASLATVNTVSLLQDRRAVALICAIKLLLMPALVLVAARYFLQLEPLTAAVLVTLAACPSGINVLPFAQHSENETRTVSAAIFASTIVSIVTLPMWVYVVG